MLPRKLKLGFLWPLPPQDISTCSVLSRYPLDPVDPLENHVGDRNPVEVLDILGKMWEMECRPFIIACL